MTSFSNPMRHWPLQWKVMLWIVLAQITLSAIVLFSVLRESDNALQVNSETVFKELDTVMSMALVDPLLQRDDALLQRLADELVKDEAVAGILITSPEGRIYAASGSDTNLPKSYSYVNKEFSLSSNARFFSKSSAITFAGQSLGTVFYSISLEKQLQARNSLLRRFFLITISTTLLAIFVGFFITLQLVRRIKLIGRVSAAAIGGDYKQRVPIDSNDELGRLGSDLNRLSETVGNRIDELVESEVSRSYYLQSSRKGEARLTSLLNSMKLGIVLLDTQKKVIYKNDALLRIWPSGVPESILFDKNIEHEEVSEVALPDGRLVSRTSHFVFEDKSIDVAVDSAVNQPSNIIGSLLVFEDVTAERSAQNMIQFLAERDSLTSLYNRRSFTQAMKNAIEENPDKPIALVYIDLDNFKLVNDMQGHQQGDKVLIDIAKKLTAATRANDIVGRIGGDEFVILASDISIESQNAWCDRLLHQLSAIDSSAVNGVNMVSSSVGIAWYPKDADTAESLMTAADQAMYLAKRSGKNAWRSFQKDEEHFEEKAKQLLWTNRLNEALKNDGFEIFLQGVHHAKTKAIHHFEALIRLPDKSNPGRFHSPSEFIGHAETSGRISKIDRWMISNTLKLLAQHPSIEPIAVNVSAVSMSDSWLPAFVKDQLDAHKVAGHRLHLELTETAALADINKAQVTVRALQALGCEVCLDDFGSGFTSLAYLKLINASYLKIDGLFMHELDVDRENQVLLRAIVDIAESSGKLTVAEWIEDEEMLATAVKFKIDLVQGFHLSRPAPAAQAVRALASPPRLLAALHE
jgi:diguanylate cyclase (GGDEF)-like protein